MYQFLSNLQVEIEKREFESVFWPIALFMVVLVLGPVLAHQETVWAEAVPLRPSLHDAARLGDSATVARLLQGGDDVNATDDLGRTALHLAASRGSLAVLELLLERGGDLSAKDNLDVTPLHEAAGRHQVGVIRTLVIEGADVDVVDHIGRTPLHWAAFTLGGGLGSTAAAAVSALIKLGADVNVADRRSGISVLHLAVYGGRTAAVEVLISAGANVNAKDDDDNTPLHVATWSNQRVAIIGKLIEGGADVNPTNKHGETPLDSAKARDSAAAFEALNAVGGRHGDVSSSLPGSPEGGFGYHPSARLKVTGSASIQTPYGPEILCPIRPCTRVES